MKALTRLFVIAVFCLFLVTLAACGKDPVSPYIAPESSNNVPEATDIDYTPPEYSDEISPSEESLDSSAEETDQDSYQYGSSMDQESSASDQESDEYKKAERIINRACSKDGTHYFGSAKFLYLTGDAMARSMASAA